MNYLPIFAKLALHQRDLCELILNVISTNYISVDSLILKRVSQMKQCPRVNLVHCLRLYNCTM